MAGTALQSAIAASRPLTCMCDQVGSLPTSWMAWVYVLTASSSRYPTNAWQDLGEIRYACIQIQGWIHEACGVLTAQPHCKGCRGKECQGWRPCPMMATATHNSRQGDRAACCVLAYQQIEVDKDALQASQQCLWDRGPWSQQVVWRQHDHLRSVLADMAVLRPTQGSL